MNYLAHLALAPNTPAARIGNLLGDFVKGTESSLRSELPSELVDGIMLHRAIDKFTDAHPAFHTSKLLLSPQRRRYAGIVLDLIYDHFLSLHWDDFYDQPLRDFIQEIYTTLAKKKEWLLGELKHRFPLMQSEDWLSSYGTIDGIKETFKRVANRSKFATPMRETYLDLEKNYTAFQSDFFIIYPDLIEFVQQRP